MQKAARIVDANLNRCREALRVVEDYARFVLNDAVISGEVKAIRHALVDVIKHISHGVLLANRDTMHDVGTAVQTAAEYVRNNTAHTAVANLKRLQESLRSAEEFGKELSISFAQAIEQLRYRSYTLEKAFAEPTQLKQRIHKVQLYVLITADQCVNGLEATVKAAAEGGAGVFQLREKNLADTEILKRAKALRAITRETGTLFIINDRPDIALLSDADGVHLGQDDLPIHEVRPMLGPDKLIGISTHDLVQVQAAVLAGADYIGVGPTFPSRTKSFSHFPGLDFLREASKATNLPTFALGGITVENLPVVLQTGISRVAVASAVTQTDNPQIDTRRLMQILAPGLPVS